METIFDKLLSHFLAEVLHMQQRNTLSSLSVASGVRSKHVPRGSPLDADTRPPGKRTTTTGGTSMSRAFAIAHERPEPAARAGARRLLAVSRRRAIAWLLAYSYILIERLHLNESKMSRLLLY